MAYSFNTTTASVAGSARTPLISVVFTDAAAEIDITDADAGTGHLYESGISNPSCTIELVGNPAIAIGATGATTISWTDGTSSTMTDSVVTNVETRGSIDDKITMSVTVRPNPA